MTVAVRLASIDDAQRPSAAGRSPPRCCTPPRYGACPTKHVSAEWGRWTTEQLDGAALFGKPGDPKPSVLHQLRELPTFAAAFGRHLPRAARAFGTVAMRRPPEPHWFLDILAVRPDRQGQGIGSALVVAGLTEADRAGVPAFVVTSGADSPASPPMR